MHVAIVGAGALGSVYGVRLATRTKASVSFVVRRPRDPNAPIALERGSLTPRPRRATREVIERPEVHLEVPADADVVLVAVGTNALPAILPALEATSAPVVVLTPMMPGDFAAMRAALGARVLAAMPNVVSYEDRGVVRYWLMPRPTLVDEPRATTGDAGVPVRALAAALSEAGIDTRFELGVHESNPATTACFIPAAMAVCVAGGLEALARDPQTTALARRACVEGVALSRRLGRADPLAHAAPLVATPLVLSAAAFVLQRLAPEIVGYIDAHFGEKLRAQHVAMAATLARLATERGTPHEALADLEAALSSARLVDGGTAAPAPTLEHG